MEDLAYLVPDSTKAWLDGSGDGRFESYERYYRRALNRNKENLDVEAVNEEYGTYARAHARASAVKAGNFIIGITLIGFGLYVSGKVVIGASDVAPKLTGALMLIGIVALKLFQRRHRRAAANK
ncbi:MAG: hypothetical protein AB1704_20100 [Pseudomonadota bacterium]|jgi:hypothetical protein